MKASYEAYMRGIKPSEEFCTALESKMKQAFYSSKRRRNPLYIGVAVTAVIMVAILLTVSLNNPDIEDNVIQSAPVVADHNTNDELSISDNTAEPSSDDVVQSVSAIAMPMTENRAIELVKQADPDAEKAIQFWIYPDGDGAWVFYATERNDAWFNGAFWYATGLKCISLGGYMENIQQWSFIDGNPSIFTWNILSDDVNTLRAFVLSNGEPVELKQLHGLISLESRNGNLYGMAAGYDYDYIFLSLSGNTLKEVAGTPVDENTVKSFPDIQTIVGDILLNKGRTSNSISIEGYIYRPSSINHLSDNIHNSAGSIAVNIKENGIDRHLYIWIDENGEMDISKGLEGDAVVLDGKATIAKDIGFEVVEPSMMLALLSPAETGDFSFESDGVIYYAVHHIDNEGSWVEVINPLRDTSSSFDFDNPSDEFVAYETALYATSCRHIAQCPLSWLCP